MFRKGTMKDVGIDITIKNNPDHVLAPDSWEMVRDLKFGKVSSDDYREYYLNLIRSRWKTRKNEFLELAKEGKHGDVVLRCYCPTTVELCHATLAAEFMNALINKMP
jgi:hypothetical protein